MIHGTFGQSLMTKSSAYSKVSCLKRVGSSPNPPDEFKKPNTSFMFSLHSLKRDTHEFGRHKHFAQEILACKHVPYSGQMIVVEHIHS